MNIAGLPTTGRCVLLDSVKLMVMLQSYLVHQFKPQLIISMQQKGGQATLSFDGVKALFEDANIGNLTDSNDKKLFF